MTPARVQAVLIFRYDKSVHTSAYGRAPRAGSYTKDYLQLQRGPDFLAAMDKMFPITDPDPEAVRPLTFKWRGGTSPGAYQPHSADRPHLRWETDSPPPPWRMTPNPEPRSVETIPGDPGHKTVIEAEGEFDAIRSRGAGTPYLVAVKLFTEPAVLYLRAYLSDADPRFGFADLRRLPSPVLDVAIGIPITRTMGWKIFSYADDVFFDPREWRLPWSEGGEASLQDDDAAAEQMDVNPDTIEFLEREIDGGNYSVPDSTATTKVRGSAQRIFAARVKANYSYRCAVTDVLTPGFIVASHVVPWSLNEATRTDPRNGICLSLLVDRAFELGHIEVADDLKVTVMESRIGADQALLDLLEPYNERRLREPSQHRPLPEYLQYRRSLFDD